MVAGITVDGPRSVTDSESTQTQGLAPDQHGAAHTAIQLRDCPGPCACPVSRPALGARPLRVKSATLPT
jgi:hypothetical protein